MLKHIELNGWRIALGAAGGFVVVMPRVIGGNDILAFLASALIALLVFFFLLGLSLRGKRHLILSSVLMVLLFFASTWFMNRFADAAHEHARWLLSSRSSKEKVLATPEVPIGDFRHIEWDGWGFAGVGDTTVYLVYDPSEALSNQLTGKKQPAITLLGVPCGIWKAERMEDHWYLVTFYTDLSWYHCTYD